MLLENKLTETLNSTPIASLPEMTQLDISSIVSDKTEDNPTRLFNKLVPFIVWKQACMPNSLLPEISQFVIAEIVLGLPPAPLTIPECPLLVILQF
jgi:hypothetical protein